MFYGFTNNSKKKKKMMDEKELNQMIHRLNKFNLKRMLLVGLYSKKILQIQVQVLHKIKHDDLYYINISSLI